MSFNLTNRHTWLVARSRKTFIGGAIRTQLRRKNLTSGEGERWEEGLSTLRVKIPEEGVYGKENMV